MNPIEGVRRNNKLRGWVQKRPAGGWRALTLSGHLTHHQSRQEAREAVRCSS